MSITTTEINVRGMTCGHCVASVEKAARSVSGVRNVMVDLKAGKATVAGDFDRRQVVEAIEEAGYEAS